MTTATEFDPTRRARIFDRLRKDLRGFSPRLQVVAKYILDNQADFGLDPIRETARKAGVSTFTLVRMARALGLGSYEELREPFRRALLAGATESDRPDWLERQREAGASGAEQAAAMANTLGIVERSLRRQNAGSTERVADLILSARAAYVTATRASYSLAYFLHYVGRMAAPGLQLIPRHMNSPIDELRDAGPEDVLIAVTVSPYSRETIEACRFARGRGVPLILITDSDVVAPELEPTASLIAETHSTHHFGSYAGLMAVIETLIAAMVARGGVEARERITAYEDLRNEIDAYWRTPKKQ